MDASQIVVWDGHTGERRAAVAATAVTVVTVQPFDDLVLWGTRAGAVHGWSLASAAPHKLTEQQGQLAAVSSNWRLIAVLSVAPADSEFAMWRAVHSSRHLPRGSAQLAVQRLVRRAAAASMMHLLACDVV